MCSKKIRSTVNNSCRALLLLMLVLLPGLAQTQEQISLDKVIAIIDDDVLLKSEFDMRWAQIQAQLDVLEGQRPDESLLRKQLLDQLIIENLQMQMATRAGVRVDDNQLNQAMNTIAQQNNMDFQQFQQVLEQQGVYLQTREQLRKDIILQQFQTGSVNNRIDITRQEVENYLRSQAGQADIAPEYRIAHILIENADGPQQSRRDELAQFLHQQLEDGAEILQFIASGEVSGIPLGGGDLGFRKAEALPSMFRDVVPGMTLGEISEPFTSSSGWHILQVKDIRGGASLEIEQYNVRHILIQPNEIRTESQAEDLINEIYQRIQDGEDFGDIARQLTDDESSIVAGGDLDWITFGQFPPEFLAVIQSLEVGEMSEPVRLESGWHIMELMDTRIEDMTDENMRFQAQQILRQRKFENELENWLTELRDTAYVDIKMDLEPEE
ncbi:peptidylprolyl isomerase [Gammaproteobacteria bacterium]|nr:peptidylprolyl isomerase [Gammaproteobacteria bacterium]